MASTSTSTNHSKKPSSSDAKSTATSSLPSHAASASIDSSTASSEGADGLPADVIDMDTFGQLLEMDDEDDRGFSQEIVWNFFEQANTTFGEMDEALEGEDLPKLSTLGHFLKGSSAAVGVIRVRDGCEAMQHLGKLHDESGVMDISREEALKKVGKTLEGVKKDYVTAEAALKKFYEEEGALPEGEE
ncbi:unnamed protein product [Sympodiomycopsis kandeliae]